jgi:hypothetical protein
MRALHDSFVLFPGAEPGSSGYRVVANTRSLYSVRLWGPLHILWADRLTRGLSNAGLSILNGFARQEASGSWGAEFLVTPLAGAPDPETIDYISLTHEPPAPQASPLLLDGFDLDGSPERGGFLYLEVRGPDRVGFLGSLLLAVSELGLVPREMWVATRFGEACDRFLLNSWDGRSPTDEERQALEAVLDGHRVRRVGLLPASQGVAPSAG